LEEKLSRIPETTNSPLEPVRPGLTTSAADASAEPGDTLEVVSVRPPIAPHRNRRTLDKTHRWVWVQFVVFGIQLALDLAAIIAGFLLAYVTRKRVDLGGPFIDFNPNNYQIILALSTVAVLLAFYNRGIYRLKRGFSKIDEFYRICAGTFLGLVLAIFFNSFLLGPNFLYSRIIFVYSMILIIALVCIVRWLFSSLVDLLRRVGLSQVRMVIVGGGEPTARIVRKVQSVPELGYVIAGIVCDQRQAGHTCEVPDGSVLLGHIDDLADIVRANEIDELIITMSGVTQAELFDLVGMCDDLPVNIRIYPEAFQLVTANEVTISALTGLPLVSVKDVALRGVNRFIKRGMDIAISLALLVIVSPVMLLIALLIKLTSPRGPVFYTQERVGLDGKPFTVYKFRSMRYVGDQESPKWTTENDPRRTRLGRFIRRYSLDELPQFINVLVGDMSIVGPRPEQPHYVEQFSRTIPRYMRRHKEKAGITGWAQVNGLRGDTSITERTRYDLYYVENWSVLFDLKIMLKTVLVIFTDKNAY
jgi:Undecaprenyl-phosphate glucose phosphotransferase